MSQPKGTSVLQGREDVSTYSTSKLLDANNLRRKPKETPYMRWDALCKLRRLARSGKSRADIAKELGRHRATVEDWVKKFGISI